MVIIKKKVKNITSNSITMISYYEVLVNTSAQYFNDEFIIVDLIDS